MKSVLTLAAQFFIHAVLIKLLSDLPHDWK